MDLKIEDKLEDKKNIEEYIGYIKETKTFLKSLDAEQEDIEELDELVKIAQGYKKELDDIYKNINKIEDIKKRNLFLEENEKKIDKLNDNIEDIFYLTKSFRETKFYYLSNKEELKSKTLDEFIKQMELEYRFVKVIDETSKVFEKLDKMMNDSSDFNKLIEVDKLEDELLHYNNELWEVETTLFGGPPDVHTESAWHYKEDKLLDKVILGSKEGARSIIERLIDESGNIPKNWGSEVKTIPLDKMQDMLERAKSLNEDIISLESLKALTTLEGDEELNIRYGMAILDKKRCLQELSHWKEDLYIDKYKEEKDTRMQNIESREYEDALDEDINNLSRVSSDMTINVDEEDMNLETDNLSKTSSEDTLFVDDKSNMSIGSFRESSDLDSDGESTSNKSNNSYFKKKIQQVSSIVKKSREVLNYNSREVFDVKRNSVSLSTKLKLFAKRLRGRNIEKIHNIINKISLKKIYTSRKFIPKFFDTLSKNIKKNITKNM